MAAGFFVSAPAEAFPSSAACVLLLLATASGLDNGLGRTPPLAWSSWNAMAADVTDAAIRSTVDALVSTGLEAAGYDAVHIDCGWSLPHRSSNGSLQADPAKFPFGIPAVVNYASARGIKVGIYSEHSTQIAVGDQGCWASKRKTHPRLRRGAYPFSKWTVAQGMTIRLRSSGSTLG